MATASTIAVNGPTFLDVVMAGMEGAPRLGSEMWVSQLALTAGGAANQAVAIARLGQPVELITRLGNDHAGQIVRAVLTENGVGTRFATAVEHQSVTVSLAWGGDRAMITHGSDAGGELPADFAPAVLVSDLRAIGANAKVVQAWRERGTKVIGDVGWDDSGRWGVEDLKPLEHCDYFVPNEAEIVHYARCTDLREAISLVGQLVDTSAQIIVTRGDAGVLAGGEEYWSMPALDVAVVDPTGAGDAFSAGLAVAIANGATEREAVSLALLLGGLSVAKPGGAGSTPTPGELASALENLSIPSSYDLGFVQRISGKTWL